MRKRDNYEEMQRVINAMTLFGDLPSDYNDFVQKEVLPTYVVYNGKKGTGFCTTCHNDFSIKGLKHNAETICPICGRKAIARSEGKPHKKTEIYWSEVFQASGDKLLDRSFRYIVDLSDYRDVTYTEAELFRSVFTSTGSDDYMWWEDCCALRPHWQAYSDSPFNNYLYPKTSDFYLPHLTTIYKGEEFNKLIANMPAYKYAPIKQLLEIKGWIENGKVYGFGMDASLNFHRQVPYAEKLLKVGLESLVKCIMASLDNRQYFDSTQKELVKILKLDKRRYEILKSVDNPSIDDLRLLQDYPNASKAEFYWLKTKGLYNYYYGLDWLRTALKHAKPERIKRKTEAYDKAMYSDYLRHSERLGVDLHDEYYLFPKNLKEAHDRTYLEYLRVTDPKKYEERAKQNALIAAASKEKSKFAPFNLHYCGMFIKVADSADALRREGDALHHCVGTYASKMANGETTILFVRREDKPDEPFYTMEWNGKVIQLRGAHNCAPTEDVAKFREEFERAIETEYAKTTQKVA